MGTNRNTPRRQPGGGAEGMAAGAAYSRVQDRPDRAARQGGPQEAQRAPTGEMRATLRGDLIYRGGRHVAALRDGALSRTYDASRELFRGALLFHQDVLDLAAQHGAHVILATERTTGVVYRVGLADFMARSWPYTHPTFGSQRGLSLAFWRRESASEPAQMTLWGGR